MINQVVKLKHVKDCSLIYRIFRILLGSDSSDTLNLLNVIRAQSLPDSLTRLLV